MSDVTVSVVDPSTEPRLHRPTGAFLAGYCNANTRTGYLQQLHRWFAGGTAHQLDATPIAAVRRPSRDETPRQTRLTRHELTDWLNAAEQNGGAIFAMGCLLLLNGLRVSEVCGIDIDDLAEERWHHTVMSHGKGDKDATIPLALRTRAALEQAVDGRAGGPLLRNGWGIRMSRNNVAAAVTWIERTYHRRRRQRALGRLTPIEYEAVIGYNRLDDAA